MAQAASATAAGISTTEWSLVSLFLFLALLIDDLGWRYLPRIFPKRWNNGKLSEDTKRRLILHLSTAPPKIHYISAPYRVLLGFYTDYEAIRLDRDGVQSLARSTWLVAAFMYGYELLKTFPPTMNDTVHHVGWIALTCFAYQSPLATQGPTHIPMIRCIAVCSFFSLGVNSVVLLGLFLMLHLGPSWTRPPRWMCRAYSVLTCIMCLSRPSTPRQVPRPSSVNVGLLL